MRRVVVTGLGMVAPSGYKVADAWDSVLESRSGVHLLDAKIAEATGIRVGAAVRGFEPGDRGVNLFQSLALAASQEAVLDAGLDLKQDTDRYGCSIGTSMGSIIDLNETAAAFSVTGRRAVSPFFLTRTLGNMAAAETAILLGLRGPNLCSTTACASGAHSIGEAFFHILCGSADVMVAGGVEASVNIYTIAAFSRMRALSRNPDPKGASRPFDRDRDGFVVGEGAGILVLESYEHARQRGAPIYAELAGYGTSCDAFSLVAPNPDGAGARRCMAAALQAAQIPVDAVDYVNCHGTSTKLNDAAESRAILALFGAAADGVAVSSTKGITGHCLGAAGAIEAAFTVLALQRGVVPPTANYSQMDPECPALDFVPGAPRETSVQVAMTNSFAFGGTNASLVFRRI